MTGQKNRFSTTEKLWNLDDKQLKTPKHDAMVLWLMDENNLKPLIKPLLEYNEFNGFFKKEYKNNEVITDNINIDSEVPIKSSPTFIAGYADLMIKWDYSVAIEKYSCPIDAKWAELICKVNNLNEMELLLKKYLNDMNYEIKQCLKEDRYHYSLSYKTCYDENGEKISSFKYDESKGHTMVIDKNEITWSSRGYTSETGLKFLDFALNIGVECPCDNDDIKEWIEAQTFYHKHKQAHLNCLIEVKPYIDSFGAVLRQIKSYKTFSPYKDNYCIFTLDDRFDAQFESQGITMLHPPDDVAISDMLDMYM